MKIEKKDVLESLLVFGIFTGILLPMRLVFYDYLSHYWLGSFGVTSVIVFTIFYLSKKGKFGKIGFIIVSKIQKRAKGKLGKFSIILSILLIYFWSNIIIGVTFVDDQSYNQAMKELKSKGIIDMKSLQEKHNPIEIDNILQSLFLLMTPNAASALVFKIANQLSNGWLLSFGSVFLIDEIEVLGIVLYFRYKKDSMILS